jgi:hypothetical protein
VEDAEVAAEGDVEGADGEVDWGGDDDEKDWVGSLEGCTRMLRVPLPLPAIGPSAASSFISSCALAPCLSCILFIFYLFGFLFFFSGWCRQKE